MPGPSLQLRRSDLLRHLGRDRGWDRDVGQWTPNQQVDGDDILSNALRQLYSPPILPGERTQHSWTCLNPWGTLTTQADVSTYDLPPDFGGLTDPLTFVSENSGPCPIAVVSDFRIRQLQQGATSISGYPDCACILPSVSDGSRPQLWQIVFYPTPDGQYELRFRYRSDPYNLIDSAPYPLGGQSMSDALLASVLASAESRLGDARGIRYEEFLEKLRSAVSWDRSHNVSSLGYCGDPSVTDYDPYPYQPVSRLYYNGIEL